MNFLIFMGEGYMKTVSPYEIPMKFSNENFNESLMKYFTHSEIFQAYENAMKFHARLKPLP